MTDHNFDSECDCEQCETFRDAAQQILMNTARQKYEQHKAERENQQEQEECPHDEHDHGICLDCGKDIMDDLIGRAELLRDE